MLQARSDLYPFTYTPSLHPVHRKRVHPAHSAERTGGFKTFSQGEVILPSDWLHGQNTDL